ncbi:hybrid sensor histidine kinase/response regulator [Aequorivita sp. CIP111184]|uniref:hybrid sensor histidine kinase/response regulator n=1 Tax=Aequorivita sp. CIP111184 TaxID=2211356 RepID=UPI000DBC04E1|nr:hybrid sensor histidine kinase/response regulator [Aequorivita sp. CIP111184]SRX54861.1 Autoinducer 2 sensor kinase/phosphatase LuxQ [Aequorivita sp. CIP111184]
MKHLLLLFFIIGFGCNAQNAVFDTENSKGKLYEYAEFYDAGKSNYELSEIQHGFSNKFLPLNSENQSTGFTTDNYWIKFKLENSNDQAKTYYLETARPITDVAELYQISNDDKITKFKSGDQIPFNERQVAHRSTVFKIELPENSEQQFYLHLKSDGETINLPFNLYTESEFWQVNYKQQMFLGLFYGILFLAGIIYLFFYTSLRAKSFLYYGIYVLSIGLMQAALDGLLFQYFFTSPSYFAARAVLITAIFSNFFLLKYCEHFLGVNSKLPRFSIIYKILYALMAIAALLIFINPKTLAVAYPICNINGMLSLLLIITTIVLMRFRKITIDRYFSIGIFFLVIGLMGFVMNNLNLLPNNFYTLNSAKFGTGFEIIFLSISMTYFIRNLRIEKEKSQEVALQKSEEISGLKSYFMSNMSHELRTPLNTIMGIAEIELSKLNNNEERKQFEIIKNASISLLSNVNDILDFEKIETKQLELKKEEFNPSIILNQISNNWREEAINKGLNYQFEMDYEIPILVKGDQERFVQIVNNVLGNAVKFTNTGNILFKMRCTKRAKGIYNFSFNISDTGVGIDSDFKQNIFDSFNQMKLDHKRRFGGIGLGLTIVKYLVELHQGTINIESTPNKGTQVFIDILIEGVVKDSSIDTPAYVESSLQNKLHVLVVEDNVLNQMVMRKMLNSYSGVSFAVVNNGAEAIEALKKDIYNIVLMDLQMPVMDGYEATRLIRNGASGKTISTIPIIAVTADAMQETHKKVLDIGMNDYMTKPVNRDLLIEKMKKYKNDSILKIA